MSTAALWELWDALAFLTITAAATGFITTHHRRRPPAPPPRHSATSHICQPPGLGPGTPWPPPTGWTCPTCGTRWTLAPTQQDGDPPGQLPTPRWWPAE